ncbi:MAG: CopD family protein [Stellaceae bacterium]
MAGTSALATAALILHALSAVVWVGGMFFAHQVLRPAAGPLDPRPRLLLWSRVLGRFFAWVIAAIVLLLGSGYLLVFAVFGGFGKVGLHVNLMQGIGILMMLLFFHLYFAPWRRFRLAVGREDWAEGGRQLGQIRTIVTINLVLGLIVVAIGSSGRYWG